jgi:hypothetical protein
VAESIIKDKDAHLYVKITKPVHPIDGSHVKNFEYWDYCTHTEVINSLRARKDVKDRPMTIGYVKEANLDLENNEQFIMAIVEEDHKQYPKVLSEFLFVFFTSPRPICLSCLHPLSSFLS